MQFKDEASAHTGMFVSGHGALFHLVSLSHHGDVLPPPLSGRD